MITAYFDDSGTHTGGKGGPSEIVLVAGIFGTEGRLDGLDHNWKQHLDWPLDGQKGPISRFHAYDCYQSTGEFTGWTRTETDYFRHQLRTAIIESGVAAYGIACLRKDYDELIIGDLRGVLGNPEGMCINQCFVRSLGWVQANTFDPKMTFVFDNRPSDVQRYTGTVYDAFAQWIRPPPQLTGYAFLSSMDVRPLQAADMIAWELYQYAKAMLVDGIGTLAHKEILHLQKNMNLQAQIINRESVIKLRDYWLAQFKDRPEDLKQMANHFNLFDPENPDYSHLYDQPPK
jgi:hypothetical protein